MGRRYAEKLRDLRDDDLEASGLSGVPIGAAGRWWKGPPLGKL